MAKRIVEYKMHKNEAGNLIIPFWISDAGYFPDGTKLIGIIDDTQEYHIPDTDVDTPAGFLHELTRAELKTRMIALGMKDGEGEDLTEEEINTLIGDWCDARSVA